MPDGEPTGGRVEREDLAEVLERRALTEDEARHDAVNRRHAGGARTARENVADLVDPGSFVEYGRFAIAAQRARRDVEELIERTPADGLVAGTAGINGEFFGEGAQAMVGGQPARAAARSPGRPPTSARWASKARSSSPCARSSRRLPTRQSASNGSAT